MNEGKLGLSLCLFEAAKYLNDESVEDTALGLLQEVLALRQKGKTVKPVEIGFVLLYLIENKLIEADFDDLFGEDTERLLSGIRFIGSYSELYLDFIPFLSLLWNLKKEGSTRQLIIEILDGAAFSLEQQSNQMHTNHFIPNLPKWEFVFECYLKASSLLDNYTISSRILEHYVTLYQRGRISNRFITGFYIEKLVSGGKNLLGKRIQKYAAQNIYSDTQTLSQQINLLYLLKQNESLYKIQIQQLEKKLFDYENPMYEKQITQMIPFNKSVIGYEAGITRLLLYLLYVENFHIRQDCKRFQYIFI